MYHVGGSNPQLLLDMRRDRQARRRMKKIQLRPLGEMELAA